MIVLGIETAGPTGSVALLTPDAPPREIVFAEARTLGSELAPAIRRMLRAAGLDGGTCQGGRAPDLVCVDVGPGSYTGLRIGLAAAKGLSFAWGCALIGVPAVVALTSQAPPVERVLCALDASRGQVYAALYSRQGRGVKEDWTAGLRDAGSIGSTLPGPTLVIGDAAPGLADTERGIVAAAPELAWPTARRIAEIGLQRYMDGERQDALRLCPTYYRPNEAEEQRRKRKRSVRDR